MNRKKIEEVANLIIQDRNKASRKRAAEEVELRDWQKKAVQKLMDQDNRKILWVIDEKGNNGKTFLASYLADKYGARIFENGRSADIKYMWNGEDIIIFDLVRSSQDHINYEVIEQIKNGRFNSTKYECKEKTIGFGKHVKMIVFTNNEPEREKLSDDRWDVMRLTGLKERDDTEPPKKRERKSPFLENKRDEDQNPIYWDVQQS